MAEPWTAGVDRDHTQESSADHTQAHATGRKIETLIRSRIAQLGQDRLADILECSPSQVSRYLSNQSCIPLGRFGPLVEALGLRVIPADELASLKLWASRYLADEKS